MGRRPVTTAFLTNDFVSTGTGLMVPGGCAYYRCYLPATTINGHLGRPTYDPNRGWGVRETKTTGMYGFTTVSLKLIMHKTTPVFMRNAQKLGQRIVVDVDDHYEGLTEANIAYDITDPEKNKRVNRDHYKEVIDTADIITVSTPFLLEWHSRTHDNVRMVRNSIDINLYKPRTVINRKPVIGWAGVTAFRNNDLEQLNDWLPDFLEEHDLQFMHAGWDPAYPDITEHLNIPDERIIRIPTATIDQYPQMLQFDIGLVPLNDIPFNHAKSNIKGLEYAASGIPFIASDVPEYRLLHESGAGLIATSADEWRQQATNLLDFTYRKQQARRGRDTVSQTWTINQRAPEWQAVFSEG